MSYVVIVLSWAGWIWTAGFFAAVGPLLLRERRRRMEALRQRFEVEAVDADGPGPGKRAHG